MYSGVQDGMAGGDEAMHREMIWTMPRPHTFPSEWILLLLFIKMEINVASEQKLYG